MKLKEVLAEYGSAPVYVGALSSFFYAGPACLFFNDCKQITDSFLNKYEKANSIHKNKMKMYGKQLRDSNLPQEKRRIAESQIDRIPKLIRRNNELSRELSSVTLPEREVIETYERLDGSGTAIIIEGNEVGRYWYMEEYASGNGQEC